MAETVITVRGSAVERHSAELAVVRVAVAHDGPRRDAVLAATTASAEIVRGSLEGHADSGLTSWSSDRVAVWSDRPWNSDGKRMPLVYHASVAFTATFAGSEALSRWVERVAAVDGADVGSVTWELTDGTRDAILERVRTRAVDDARAKALVFARAAGLQGVRAIASADPGLLGVAENPGAPSAPMARMAFAASDSAPALALVAGEIEVVAAVDARFVAD
jgi:uncharacterized protein